MSNDGHELQLTSNTVSKSWENDKFADWNTFSPHNKYFSQCEHFSEKDYAMSCQVGARKMMKMYRRWQEPQI